MERPAATCVTQQGRRRFAGLPFSLVAWTGQRPVINGRVGGPLDSANPSLFHMHLDQATRCDSRDPRRPLIGTCITW